MSVYAQRLLAAPYSKWRFTFHKILIYLFTNLVKYKFILY
jgi:hypothetical protein